MKVCGSCGAQMTDEKICCTKCGAPLEAGQDYNQPYQQQDFNQPYQQTGYQPINNQPVNNKALAALILGIGGIVLILVAPFLANFPALVGLIVSIVAIVIGVKARNELPVGHPNRSMATGGLVCGVIGTVLGGIATLCTVCVCSLAACFAIGVANSDHSFLSEYADIFTILFRF